MEVTITVRDELVPFLTRLAETRGMTLREFLGQFFDKAIFFALANKDDFRELVEGNLSKEDMLSLLGKVVAVGYKINKPPEGL